MNYFLIGCVIGASIGLAIVIIYYIITKFEEDIDGGIDGVDNDKPTKSNKDV